jgi:diadenosine tetraphosphate (Ap4A) HIT family hydrolase
MFTLDPRFAADTVPVTTLGLSQVLLMDRRAWAWLVLVPQIADLRELIDMADADRRRLGDEVAQASRVLQRVVPCDKLNVASFGNVVAQLHVHVIARVTGDAVWPKPVWAVDAPEGYDMAARDDLVARLRAGFGP